MAFLCILVLLRQIGFVLFLFVFLIIGSWAMQNLGRKKTHTQKKMLSSTAGQGLMEHVCKQSGPISKNSGEKQANKKKLSLNFWQGLVEHVCKQSRSKHGVDDSEFAA